MIGHKKSKEDFKRLADNDNLSHAYLFFGEPQVGKFLFALSFANYLENHKFEEPKNPLRETLVVSCETIGIDDIRSMRNFLYQKSVFSPRRAVIIRDAENLTTEAQSAILKIIEEPPFQSLIIFVVNNPDVLLPTLVSRMQKIYFSRIGAKEIADFLKKNFRLSEAKAKSVVQESFGRPGRAIQLTENLKLKTKNLKLDDIIDNNQIDGFFESLIIDLYKEPVKNCGKLKKALRCLVLMKQFNVNKKLQINSLLKNL